jgi:osmotically-inducible protein OsmY
MNEKVPAILALMLVVALAGCASAVSSGYGQGGMSSDGRSYSEARADNAITAQVNTLLVRDPQIRAMDIEVSTRDRVVTLSGTVPSRELAYRAGRLAASVEGVNQVVNRLRVAP